VFAAAGVRVAGLAALFVLAVGGCSGPGGVSQLIPNAVVPGPPEMSASQFCAAWLEFGRTTWSSWTSPNRAGEAEKDESVRRSAEQWANLAEVAPQEIRADVRESAQKFRQLAEGTTDAKTYIEDTAGSRARLLSWSAAHCPRPSIAPLPSGRPGPSI